MKLSQEEILRDLYNIILNSGTREWEREQFSVTKNALENGENLKDQVAKLEAVLRPLALRNNLTPDAADFYLKITNTSSENIETEKPKYFIKNLSYEERARFAGGCFWCMVEPFETKPGILSVLSGYTGGEIDYPTYDQVLMGNTGHVEAVEIIFDNRIISYSELVELYWQLTDPTDAFGQFQDRGNQYKPIIFVQNEEQKRIAEESKKRLELSGKYKNPIVTEIKMAKAFWPAENYHQEFYKKQPKRYKKIKHSRQQFLMYQKLRGWLRLKRKK